MGGVGHTPFGRTSNGTSSDVSKANIPQNGNAVNTPDVENSAAKAQQAETGHGKRRADVRGEAFAGKQMYAVIKIDTKGNYRGTIEKANVLVTAFGTNLKYIENQMRKGTELPIKKRTSFASDTRTAIALWY